MLKLNPAGRVPVLVDEGFCVWDTLAIAETLAEKFPERQLCADARARARARAAPRCTPPSRPAHHSPHELEASPQVGAPGGATVPRAPP